MLLDLAILDWGWFWKRGVPLLSGYLVTNYAVANLPVKIPLSLARGFLLFVGTQTVPPPHFKSHQDGQQTHFIHSSHPPPPLPMLKSRRQARLTNKTRLGINRGELEGAEPVVLDDENSKTNLNQDGVEKGEDQGESALSIAPNSERGRVAR